LKLEENKLIINPPYPIMDAKSAKNPVAYALGTVDWWLLMLPVLT
jgi:hypothetical protein